MENRKRAICMRFWVNEEERERIFEQMKKAKAKDFGSFARKSLIDGWVITPSWDELKGVHRQLAGVATNINQIAYRVNATHSVYRSDIESLRQMVTRIYEMFRYMVTVMEKLDRGMDR